MMKRFCAQLPIRDINVHSNRRANWLTVGAAECTL